LQGLQLAEVQPGVVVPGSLINIEGARFVDSTLGDTELHLLGQFTASTGSVSEVELEIGPLSFVDFEHMQVAFGASAQQRFPAADGEFSGEAWVEVQSTLDGQTYASGKLPLAFDVRSKLEPSLTDAQTGGLFFFNDRVDVQGDGFFLSEGDGTTVAVVAGFFRALGIGPCEEVSPQECTG